MQAVELSDQEFRQFQTFLFNVAGISLSPAKKPLVRGRLAKRLLACGCASYSDYFRLVASGHSRAETQHAIDQLTTNETHFFREPAHFESLHAFARERAAAGREFRVWSAACSSGEEPYTIAMTLAESLGEAADWRVLGSDLSLRVLQAAARGHYPIEAAESIPPALLKRHCLRGTGPQAGTLLVDRRLRARVEFRQINLNQPLPEVGSFDCIFLRNVMIYFGPDMKRSVVGKLATKMKPGARLVIGHSESLQGLADHLEQVAPTIYRVKR